MCLTALPSWPLGSLNHVESSFYQTNFKNPFPAYSPGFCQLKIFKNDSEKILKTAYTLTKDSYVGTERGAIQSKKRSETSIPYWAVILNTDSVVFQEIDGGFKNSGVDLKDWDLALKEQLPSGEVWNIQTNKQTNKQAKGAWAIYI